MADIKNKSTNNSNLDLDPEKYLEFIDQLDRKIIDFDFFARKWFSEGDSKLTTRKMDDLRIWIKKNKLIH